MRTVRGASDGARVMVGRHGGPRLPLLAVLVFAAIGAQGSGDPYRPQQWHIDHIGASTAWETSTGEGTVIAVIDTGVDLSHPDLVDRLYRDPQAQVVGRDFVDDDDTPQDEHGHGTMVAGLAAAATDNGVGVASVAPDARIMPVRVLDEDGAGNGEDVDDGIRWAVDQGADVINLSLESVELAPGSGILQAPVGAVRYAWNRGVVVVAAAGNSSNAFTDYPPTSPVVLVGATDRDDRKAAFSDSGREDAVMAPGVEIVSTWCRTDAGGSCSTEPRDRYGRGDGTSFAAPQVAGVVALLRAQGLDHRQAVDRLRSTAEDLGPEGPDRETGVGRVNAAAAVGSPEEGSTPEDTTAEPTPDTGPALEGSPGTATEPDLASPNPDATPSPTDASAGAPQDAAPEVTTVPAPGSEIEGLEPVQQVDPGALKWLASALVVTTFALVLVVQRESRSGVVKSGGSPADR